MRTSILVIVLLIIGLCASAASDTVRFVTSLDRANEHLYHVEMQVPVYQGLGTIDLNMPAWTPGYYQILNFGDHVEGFHVADGEGNTLSWTKIGVNRWRVGLDGAEELYVQYEVRAEKNFVAIPYIDNNRAFLRPTGLFLYSDHFLELPVSVEILGVRSQDKVATGLLSSGENRFVADNMDILYDSPLLIGDLVELPSFEIEDKTHRFLGYGMVDFDHGSFMLDVKNIVQVATQIIGHIPYEDYTFIGLGPGNGGIEQLNSTAIAFTGEGLDRPESRLRTLSFIAHEYFHHYNVKRIRPIELGPFDYSRPNRTDGLWLSEGLTVYYEGVILNRTGLINGEQLLERWQNIIHRYEDNVGKTKQTLAESSLNTWEDGPFGKRGETISFYEKGPIIGMLLDICIRSSTDNQKTLDDLMKELYQSFYLEKKRGFTAEEVQRICEDLAGHNLQDVFSYIYTTQEIDYEHYFSLIGLAIERNRNTNGETSFNLKRVQLPSSKQVKMLESVFGF